MRQRALSPRPGLDPRADDVAGRLRALGDPIRLRLLGILARGDCPVTSLAAALGIGQSLVSFHLGALRDARLVAVERRGRFTYARVDPSAVALLFAEAADLLGLGSSVGATYSAGLRVVLFASRLGSGRPLLAAGLFNQLAPPGLYAVAAGTRPADQALVKVARVLREHGVDVARLRPKLLTEGLVGAAELLVTFDADEELVDLPPSSIRRRTWRVPAVAGAPISTVRAVCDGLREQVTALLAELDRPDQAAGLGAGDQPRAAVDAALAVLHAQFDALLGADRVADLVRQEAARLHDNADGDATRLPSAEVLVEHAGQRLRAIAQAERRSRKQVPELLFVCAQNAGRSQMAAAFAERLGGGQVHAWSAGSQPAGRVHQEAAAVMAEVGIDLTEQVPRPWTNELIGAADVVVTMGCGEDCPRFPGVRYVEWTVPDPAGKPLGEARRIRDQLRGQVQALLAGLLDQPAPAQPPPVAGRPASADLPADRSSPDRSEPADSGATDPTPTPPDASRLRAGHDATGSDPTT